MKHNNKKISIGVDIGGTSVKLGKVLEDGTLIEQTSFHTQKERGVKTVVSEILNRSKDFMGNYPYHAAGIGIPGTTDSETGTVVLAPNLGWRNIALSEEFSKFFTIPVYYEQDSAASAFAEYQCGGWKEKGKKNIICITLGTGIGCGIIINGSIYKGLMHSTGEIGHTTVVPEGRPCSCGKKGCLETVASSAALLDDANRKIPGFSSDSGTVKTIFDLALNGQSKALDIVQNFVKYIGIALANLANILCPEALIISGGISNAPNQLLLDPLKKFIQEHTYRVISDTIEVQKSYFTSDVPLIGAGLLYKNTN